jgi:hypothetical protein
MMSLPPIPEPAQVHIIRADDVAVLFDGLYPEKLESGGSECGAVPVRILE